MSTGGARLGWLILLAALLTPGLARAQERSFAAGALLIPMDVDYQDDGMFQAFGLIYQLLLADIPVYWLIDPDKEPGGVDVEVAAVDAATGDEVTDLDETDAPTGRHAYRGGPFAVEAAHAEEALAVVTDWQTAHETTVHRATEAFVAYVSRTLTVAPTIAVFADGNEDIAFGYLNAAAIPDSLGQAWPEHKDGDALYPDHPDVLNVAEVRGPTDASDTDGALFDESGLPVYCQIMTMHWGVNDRDDEAIAEFRAFLQYPTHFMAECQAVNAVENSVNGRFLTPNGYLIGDRPSDVEVVTAHLPFGQFDGTFDTVGGSEPAYSLPEGDAYYDLGVVLLTELGTPIGENDVWMTGFVDGACLIDPKNPEEAVCTSRVGKVSYLGGHRYSTDTPISDNPDAQGTRLFLNSLFEADCVTTAGQPAPGVTLGGPHVSRVPQVALEVIVANTGPGIALDATLEVRLPAGLRFEDSVPAPTDRDGGTLTWDLGSLGPETEHPVALEVTATAVGDYTVEGDLDYRVGQNARSVSAEPFGLRYDPDAELPGDDGAGDALEPDAGTDTGGDDLDGGTGDDLGGDGASADAAGDAVAPDGDAAGAGGDAAANDDPSARPGSGGAPEEGCGCAAAGSGPPSALLALLALAAPLRRRSRVTR